MNVQTKIKTKRYLMYALIIFLAHILQNIVPVFPESASVRPILLIPVAVCIAMFEGELVGAVAAVTGGKGGGRPDSAMAGGVDTSKIDEALKKSEEIVETMSK